MKDSPTDSPMCFLCDYGWILLLLLVIAAVAYFTFPYWAPLVGLL